MKPQKKSNKPSGNPSWGKGLDKVFRFVNFIQHYRIYRMFAVLPKSVPLIIGRIFAVIMNGKNKVLHRKIASSIRTFLPNASPQQINSLVNASIIHMGQLLIDVMLHFPNITPKNIQSYLKYSHLDRLDRALAVGKGVLLPTVHIGNFFSIVAALVGHPKKYPLVVIANMGNQKVFEELIVQKGIKHLYMVGRDDFAKLEQILLTHLNANHCILIMYDMGKKTQLRTPFWYNRYPFLVHTPQSIFSLHRKTGAPILPVVAKPINSLLLHEIYFCDPSPLDSVSQQFCIPNTMTSKKQIHGELALTLNQILFPYLTAFPHVWEEVHNFTISRSGDELCFIANITLNAFISQCHAKLYWILENSYEAHRKDDKLSEILTKEFPKVTIALRDPNHVLFFHKTRIQLRNLTGLQNFQKITNIIKDLLKNKNENEAHAILMQISNQWAPLFPHY